MSCAASAVRPPARLRAFILSVLHPRRLARRVGEGHAHAGKALLLVLILALLVLQVELHAHALSHLPGQLQPIADTEANRAGPGEEERHTDAICLECLALTALDVPAAAPSAFRFGEHSAASPPDALAPPASARSRLRPHCRAPPASAPRHLPC